MEIDPVRNAHEEAIESLDFGAVDRSGARPRPRRRCVGGPDTATLRAVADNLDLVISRGEPERAKALLATLIVELRVNSRSEILPTYRVGAPVVCALGSSVEPTGIEPVTSCLQSRRSPS
jgi:hypothetical protein